MFELNDVVQEKKLLLKKNFAEVSCMEGFGSLSKAAFMDILA